MTNERRAALIRALPYARRYARALTGDQSRGDGLVAESLKGLLEQQAEDKEVQHGLYQMVTRLYNGHERVGSQKKEGQLSATQRQLLLLTALEDLSLATAARIVDMPQAEAESALAEARERLRATAATDVLIIEDEPIIAMDIEELVENCGHHVVGIASSEAEAVEIARRTRPGLILADINLGVGGDGTNAVARIMQTHPVPVIFVTAYPERLLTGESLEPVYVITKPFEPTTLAIATYQAVAGGVHID